MLFWGILFFCLVSVSEDVMLLIYDNRLPYPITIMKFGSLFVFFEHNNLMVFYHLTWCEASTHSFFSGERSGDNVGCFSSVLGDVAHRSPDLSNPTPKDPRNMKHHF